MIEFINNIKKSSIETIKIKNSEGEVLSTIVNDDLSGLDYLNVIAQGFYKNI